MTALPDALPTEIVTVTSRDYLPGTQVMLHSFLRNNPWFTGQIVILQDDLGADDMAALTADFGEVFFPPPSAALSLAIDQLVEAVPKLADRRRRFFSLDAFHPDRAGRILFCDSDLLFQSDIRGLASNMGPIVACGDRAQIVGSGRHPVSLAEFGNGQAPDSFTSFNAGLMLLDPALRSPANWSAMLGQIAPDKWQDIASDHTDQAVYNRLFGHQVTLADPAFNYLVGHGETLRAADAVAMRGAKVLHFNGPVKPWRFGTHQAAAARDAGFVKAAKYWFDAYSQYLTAHHFAANHS